MRSRYLEPKKLSLFDIVGTYSYGIDLALKVGLVPVETTLANGQPGSPKHNGNIYRALFICNIKYQKSVDCRSHTLVEFFINKVPVKR